MAPYEATSSPGAERSSELHAEEVEYMQLCQLAIRLYYRHTDIASLPSGYRRLLSSVVKIVREKFPQASSDSRAAERMIYSLLVRSKKVHPPKGIYTENELRIAMLKGITYNMSVKQLQSEFGVSKSTYFRHRDDIIHQLHLTHENAKQFFKDSSNLTAIEGAILQLKLEKPGPRPLLDQVERDTAALQFEERDKAGAGLGRAQVQENLQHFVEEKATDLEGHFGPDDIFVKRLRRAKCGKNFIRRNLLAPGALTKMTPSEFNRVLTEAYHNLQADPALSAVIKRGFEKTGTYPLVNLAAAEDRTEEASQALLRTAAVSEAFVVDRADQQALERLKNDARRSLDSVAMTVTDANLAAPPERFHQAEGTEMDVAGEALLVTPLPNTTPPLVALHLQEATPEHPQYAVIMRAAAAHFHEKGFVTPARELQEVLRAEKAAKKTKIPNAAKNCLNPDTTTGMCVVSEVLERLEQTELNRAERKAEKEAAKQRNADKAMQTRAANLEHARNLLAVARSDRQGWKQLNLPVIKGACSIYLTGEQKVSSASKKAEFIAALEPVLLNLLANEEPNSDDEGFNNATPIQSGAIPSSSSSDAASDAANQRPAGDARATARVTRAAGVRTASARGPYVYEADSSEDDSDSYNSDEDNDEEDDSETDDYYL